MKPDLHKQKATKEWKKKHGINQSSRKEQLIAEQPKLNSLDDFQSNFENQEASFRSLISSHIQGNKNNASKLNC